MAQAQRVLIILQRKIDKIELFYYVHVRIHTVLLLVGGSENTTRIHVATHKSVNERESLCSIPPKGRVVCVFVWSQWRSGQTWTLKKKKHHLRNECQ